jgi:hypothetical protein
VAATMTLAEPQVAFAALASLCADQREAVDASSPGCGGCGRSFGTSADVFLPTALDLVFINAERRRSRREKGPPRKRSDGPVESRAVSWRGGRSGLKWRTSLRVRTATAKTRVLSPVDTSLGKTEGFPPSPNGGIASPAPKRTARDSRWWADEVREKAANS